MTTDIEPQGGALEFQRVLDLEVRGTVVSFAAANFAKVVSHPDVTVDEVMHHATVLMSTTSMPEQGWAPYTDGMLLKPHTSLELDESGAAVAVEGKKELEDPWELAQAVCRLMCDVTVGPYASDFSDSVCAEILRAGYMAAAEIVGPTGDQDILAVFLEEELRHFRNYYFAGTQRMSGGTDDAFRAARKDEMERVERVVALLRIDIGPREWHVGHTVITEDQVRSKI